MIREDVLQQFPQLFGIQQVNGREINVEETIASLTRELRPAIAEALNARRALLASKEPVRKKYAWPSWDESFDDPVTGKPWTFRQIVQGLIDNFLGHDSESALAPERRSAGSCRRASVAKSRAGADRTVASAGHGVQRLEQRRADEHAGFRRCFSGSLSGERQREEPGGNVRCIAECEGDFSGRVGQQVLRRGEEGQDALLQARSHARQMANSPGASAEHSHCV